MDDKEQFFILEMKERGVVTFGNNGKGKIIGIDKIQIIPTIFINNVLLVDNLKHNLLSISQLCDKKFDVIFKLSFCIVTGVFDDSIKFIGHRRGNIYLVNLDEIDMKSGQYLKIGRAHV